MHPVQRPRLPTLSHFKPRLGLHRHHQRHLCLYHRHPLFLSVLQLRVVWDLHCYRYCRPQLPLKAAQRRPRPAPTKLAN